MTRRRWIADQFEHDRAWLLGEHARHLSRVLRARPGQEFDVACNGVLRRGVITSLDEDRVEFVLHEEVPAGELREVTILLAVFKFDRYEWAVEKLTELGVSRIVPFIARRTDAHLAKAADKRVERWRRIAAEASEQSRRTAPPTIDAPAKLKSALASVPAGIVLSEVEQGASLAELASGDEPISLAVGPEGGWTNDELALFTDAGWRSASLGATILRAETAAIAAAALALIR